MQKLQRISSQLYYLPPYQETDRPVLAAVVGKNKTLLIDAGNSSQHAKLFKDQLAEQGIHGDLLVLTHWHWDHVFGMKEMDLPVISHSMTFEKIIEMQELSWEDKNIDERVEAGIEIPFCADAIKKELKDNREIQLPDPNILYDSRIKVNVGGVTCEIEHVGGDHSPDSCIIYIREEKALFLGDCLYANMYAKKWNYTIEKIGQLLHRIEQYDAELYFLSHHPAPLNKNEFDAFVQLLKTSAELTNRFEGEEEAIIQEMKKRKQGVLDDLDFEIIGYFVNGYNLYK